MPLDHILEATAAIQTGSDKWLGHCVAHGSSKHRDLSIRLTDQRILLYCFAACSVEAVVAGLGLGMKDLFFDAPTSRAHRPIKSPKKIDLVAVAFRFELAALDRRLKAQRIFQAATDLDLTPLSDDDLAQALAAVGVAYGHVQRAECLESVADVLRERAWEAKWHR